MPGGQAGHCRRETDPAHEVLGVHGSGKARGDRQLTSPDRKGEVLDLIGGTAARILAEASSIGTRRTDV